MKLLSWMRTTKQTGLDPSKEFKGDFCCLRAQVSSQVQDIRTNSFSFSGSSHHPNPPGIAEELQLDLDEDGFCGFLAIGTLGMDPETPKFAASVVEDVTEEKEEFGKVITEKLEKFLEKDTDRKLAERWNAEEDRELDVCPLQGCNLFRSAIELTKRSNEEVKKKKGLLTGLFKRRQTVEGEFYMEKHDTSWIKRIFEKLHRTSPLKTRNNDDDDSIPKKKELRKSLQIFRSKVHPVFSTLAADDNEMDDRRSCINRCDLKVPSLTGGSLGSSSISKANMKRENWIKTDAECKSKC
ncbi:hypothetical protein AALP_AA5G037800 [Arabis alpina]|uniref:Uncharacterized protein n=1 Tax=Arabis alpina TaxID=50452 RepID=A0A087GUS2_ARAAL|nr:hypothetical protein AALP_AA5G037800 [Arabis alpina]